MEARLEAMAKGLQVRREDTTTRIEGGSLGEIG